MPVGAKMSFASHSLELLMCKASPELWKIRVKTRRAPNVLIIKKNTRTAVDFWKLQNHRVNQGQFNFKVNQKMLGRMLQDMQQMCSSSALHTDRYQDHLAAAAEISFSEGSSPPLLS